MLFLGGSVISINATGMSSITVACCDTRLHMSQGLCPGPGDRHGGLKSVMQGATAHRKNRLPVAVSHPRGLLSESKASEPPVGWDRS